MKTFIYTKIKGKMQPFSADGSLSHKQAVSLLKQNNVPYEGAVMLVYGSEK